MNDQEPQDIPAAEPEPADFIAVDLILRGGADAGGVAMVRWDRPARVGVSVQLPGAGPEKTFERAWQGTPADAEALQAALAGQRDRGTGPGGDSDFSLRLSRAGKKFAARDWTSAGEPRDLAELRGRLERLGHVPCAVAMACWRRGDAYARDGLAQQAAASFREGVRALGNHYQHPDTIDDTGMKLVLADANERKREYAVAATLLGRVLESRIQMYILHHMKGLEVGPWQD
jgi:hypothetical protein